MNRFVRINRAEYSILLNIGINIDKQYIEEYNNFLEYLKIKCKNNDKSIIIYLSKNRIFLLNKILENIDSLDWNFQKLKSKILKMSEYYKIKTIIGERK